MEKFKLSILPIVFCFLFISEKDTYADNFELIMTASEIERSKDSHTTDYDIVIKDNSFYFSKKSSGHGAKEPEKVTCSLSDLDMNSIYKRIKDLGLLISDTSVNDKNAVGMYFTCGLVITDSNGKYKILINGAENHFDNEDLVTNVKKLLSDFKVRSQDC